MTEKRGLKRILWSYDAFEAESATRGPVVAALAELAARTGASVQPVYVLGPADLNLPLNLSAPWFKTYGPLAERAMLASLRRDSFAGLEPPKVLFRRTASRRQSVRALLAYARGTGADLIVAGTHARKGLSRLFLGSFTETLLLESRLPVLSVGPESERVPFDRILLASDFSEGSERVLDSVLPLAQRMGSELVVFHAVRRPVEAVIDAGVYLGGPGWIPAADFLQQDEDRKGEVAEEWVRRAKDAGVRARAVLSLSVISVAEGILDEARERKVGLIALAAQSGALSSALLGSVARQVVREAACPVWVLRGGARKR